MRLTRVDVRFFRSFNFDYELKARDDKEPRAWEDTRPAWFPFVRVPLERDVTAIVGANEAGKSQLLTAIKAALTGSPIERADFCRYSELYSVKSGEIRLPEFGGTFSILPGDDSVAALPELEGVSEFTLYRPGSGAAFLVVNDERVELSAVSFDVLQRELPTFKELRTDLAIPDSVSIDQLAGRPRSVMHERGRRKGIFQILAATSAFTEQTIGATLWPQIVAGSTEASREIEEKNAAEFELARQLLVEVAGVDETTFVELSEAIGAGREGQVAAIVGAINSAIRENLNVQRWWSQDRDFDLLVEAREHELAFTIQDRTTAKYSFKERSQGLRFFLSYFVQLTAHHLRSNKPDILLLDEPDAFLSSVGQQDLLRVLQEYASPEDASMESQVVYVTHSPFLIDKNAPHRIRVLDKGSEDEGTRVVNDAANNRYEPLRSSLGAHVAETAFIGGQNLFVEGPADQILIAGLSAHIAKQTQTTSGVLNLNDVTVVASGGADGIPYLVYLARGRDTVKPACVALLDGDSAGVAAEKVLKRGEARKKRILRDEHIVRLDLWAASSGLTFEEGIVVKEIEDLIPTNLAHRAALNYLARFNELSDLAISDFTPEAILSELKSHGRVWDALQAVYVANFPDEHLEKAGFAREVVSLLTIDPGAAGAYSLRERFASLLGLLATRLEDAADEEDRTRSDDRLRRAIKGFGRDHHHGMRKHDARKLLRELGSALDTTEFGDEIRTRIGRINREFELDDPAVPTVPRFSMFKAAIKALGSSERLSFQDDALKDPSAAALSTDTHRESEFAPSR